ncbi:MAG: alpha-amylase, partial [Candidatus Aenigmarchaeota archaeon]|nr:alpha-amylase [Candidatus Aenigmarchaeota archaeon]
MTSINLCFQVHQPFRLTNFQSNGIVSNQEAFSKYFNHGLDKYIFDRVASRCYYPTNRILLELIDNFKK